jgi:hypothetical protein
VGRVMPIGECTQTEGAISLAQLRHAFLVSMGAVEVSSYPSEWFSREHNSLRISWIEPLDRVLAFRGGIAEPRSVDACGKWMGFAWWVDFAMRDPTCPHRPPGRIDNGIRECRVRYSVYQRSLEAKAKFASRVEGRRAFSVGSPRTGTRFLLIHSWYTTLLMHDDP